MKQKNSLHSRGIILLIMSLLFLAGVVLAVQTSVWSNQAIYDEHDQHLSDLASTVDHNINVVLNRCRIELSVLVKTDYFYSSEKLFRRDNNAAPIKTLLRNNALLLTDYADRIVVFKDKKSILSTEDNDALDYLITAETGSDDVWLCTDNSTGKSFFALSCPSENYDYTYYFLIDLQQFFRRVVIDTIYEDHWVVLYDEVSGLALQNERSQPDHEILTPDEILARNDGYTKILEHQQSGKSGASEYRYTDNIGEEYGIRMFVIPSSLSENRIFAVSVAVNSIHISLITRSMTFYSLIAAGMIAFSSAAAAFMLLHSGRREKELANEIASLEKEKQLSDEIIRNQEQLVHHQKLETIGTLTAGIAHEFNNLLSPIMGNSMLILEKSRTEDQEIFDNALDIYEASDRAKKLVQSISRLSRRQSAAQMRRVLPEKLISDVLSMSTASAPGNIEFRKIIETDSAIFGDESQLGHMLLNLVINAFQAMTPDGGTLTLSARSDDNNVYISVSDTGKGIPTEALETIFDPFFTTKDPGKGTGLGLSIAQRTAINHGGFITAENLPEGGARFTFTVPVYRE